MFKEVTTGASNDFEHATKIARAMVTEYGMSELGPIQLEEPSSSIFLGRDYNKAQNFSSEIAYRIDEEIRKIIDKQYKVAEKIIKDNKELLDLIANALLEQETITKEEIDEIVANYNKKGSKKEKKEETK
jgi:cell division protease FtsH